MALVANNRSGFFKWYCRITSEVSNEEISILEFSVDGNYLASFGTFPKYTINVWDWRGIIANPMKSNLSTTIPKSYLLCSTSNKGPAKCLSFCPFNKNIICTSDVLGTEKEYDEFSKMDRMGELNRGISTIDIDLEIGKNSSKLPVRGIRFWKITPRPLNWEVNPMYFC